MGIVTLMELALHDYLQGMPPQIEVLVRMNLPRYYEALAGKGEVAEEAKRIRREIKQKMQEERESEREVQPSQ